MFTVPNPRNPKALKDTGLIAARRDMCLSRSPPVGLRGSYPHHGARCRLFWYVRAAEVTLEVILCEYSRRGI